MRETRIGFTIGYSLREYVYAERVLHQITVNADDLRLLVTNLRHHSYIAELAFRAKFSHPYLTTMSPSNFATVIVLQSNIYGTACTDLDWKSIIAATADSKFWDVLILPPCASFSHRTPCIDSLVSTFDKVWVLVRA